MTALLEPAEVPLLLRVDDVDCPHRQFCESVGAPDRTTKSSRVAGVQPTVTLPAVMPPQERVRSESTSGERTRGTRR